MSDSFIRRLIDRYRELDRALINARRRRWIDPREVLKLKKLKLAVKDRIAAASRRPTVST